jgi:hypothetical protein
MLWLLIAAALGWVNAVQCGFCLVWLLPAAGCSAALVLWPSLSASRLRRRLGRIAGVASPQTWSFTNDSIVVVNPDGQTITSPWSVVTQVTKDESYCLLMADEGVSPIPLSCLQDGDFDYIVCRQALGRQLMPN